MTGHSFIAIVAGTPWIISTHCKPSTVETQLKSSVGNSQASMSTIRVSSYSYEGGWNGNLITGCYYSEC